MRPGWRRYCASELSAIRPDSVFLLNLEFQSKIAACGLLFEATPYTYTPHCTIAVPSDDLSDNAHNALMAFPVPDHEIRVPSVSFYTVETESQRCYQHERIALGV